MRLGGLSLLAFCVKGWDADGHAAIGMTCMSGIKSGALSQLKRLLGGKDVVDISLWSHQLVAKYPEMTGIYYQTQDREVDEGLVNCDYFKGLDNCQDGVCIMGALNYYFNKLVGTESHTQFVSPLKLKLSDTDLIKLIASLVAELHSVSRFGYTYNRNGKDLNISYLDNHSKVDTTQFKYWDRDLVQKTIKDRPHFWFSGWTHMNNLARPIIQQEETLWKSSENKTEIFEQWAASTFRDSCQRVFRDRTKASQYSRLQIQLKNKHDPDLLANMPILKTDLGHEDTPQGALGPGLNERDINYQEAALLPTNHLYIDFDLLKHKILLGGLRLSFVINHILTHKDAKKLRMGSAVQLKNHNPPVSGSGMWGNHRQEEAIATGWSSNLITNLAIVGVIVAGFIAFLNFTGDKVARPGEHAGPKVKD
ncbi:putative S1/P1nuclease [Gregarina niphandrodes]|uniref:S1/P1nuclease n=1 Tax=Gregarina niphandrodes TaxID=110365 RepID=A0A023B6A6_GRENI|nr:putative S1/P1nuclease [Gregarina niphandrodes]EZG65892.1 putative S1/P1nuclease [Gregarina niphandrodes]|eukprot:XP_011134050.1 putative S1/P1nuclease [Gregarina niphandrodes]